MYGGETDMARNKFPEETVHLILDEAYKLFVEKGYDKTSIQDIINHLGGLSKGAIYHHFKSKEDIFQAVSKKIELDNIAYYNNIRDNSSLNGYEKLKKMIKSGCDNPSNDMVIAMANKFMSDPKFMMSQIINIYEVVVPNFIQPIIQQGVSDGSIRTAHPKELAEVITTLVNIWINPVISKATPESMATKLEFFRILLKGIGIDILDDDTISQYKEYAKRYI